MLKEELQAFGEELREMRQEMHMSQEKLAEALDVDLRMISRYENGNAEMGSLMYRKMLQIYQSWKYTQIDNLLQQIMKLTPEKKGAIETIFSDIK